MRQVVINGHSPRLVNEVPEETLAIADEVRLRESGQRLRVLRLRGLSGTWRVPIPKIGMGTAWFPGPR